MPGADGLLQRSGITIDQCTECRGIFLDRGELERLIDAEAGYGERDHREYGDDDYYRGRDKHHRGRGGFLGELFD